MQDSFKLKLIITWKNSRSMDFLIKKQAESNISFGTDFQSCISCMFLLTIEDSILSPAVNNVNYFMIHTFPIVSEKTFV